MVKCLFETVKWVSVKLILTSCISYTNPCTNVLYESTKKYGKYREILGKSTKIFKIAAILKRIIGPTSYKLYLILAYLCQVLYAVPNFCSFLKAFGQVKFL